MKKIIEVTCNAFLVEDISSKDQSKTYRCVEFVFEDGSKIRCFDKDLILKLTALGLDKILKGGI